MLDNAKPHARLRLQKHSSGYWRGTYRDHSCMASRRTDVWRAHLHGLLEPGRFITLEHLENYLMRRIDEIELMAEATAGFGPTPGIDRKPRAHQGAK
jgi:hypothetical protein